MDKRRVVPDREAKSVSHETTFARDIADCETLRMWLVQLTEQVARRLRRNKLCGKTVQLKIRFSNFRTITRACSLPEATNLTDELLQAAVTVLDANLRDGHAPVRLLGMGVSGIMHSGPRQQLLFDQQEREKQTRLDAVMDQVQDQFGTAALARGGRSGKRRGGREEN